MTAAVTIPMINPNETEALLASLNVQEGQRVSRGDRLATLETTKSTSELEAETGGFVIGLRAKEGQTLRVGERLCYIAEKPDWKPPAEPEQASQAAGEDGALPGLRITKPALKLARQSGIELSQLPLDRLVTESTVRHLVEAAAQVAVPVSAVETDLQALVIYGGGGHGKALIDLVRALKIYTIVGVLDDGLPAGGEIMGFPVLGGAEALAGLHQRGVRQAVNAVGGIGDIAVRIKVFKRLEMAGFTCPAVVHPSAVIEPGARIAQGAQVFAHAYVGSESVIGFGAIVNTGAIVSHECRLGEFANLSPGAILAGQVEIGAGALIGMGATVNLRVRVGAGARVGNGATVKEDVPENAIVRAGSVWPR
jgi:acetyltransferase EpsM